MRLLIIGATGATGRELVSQAIAHGHDVAALVRDAVKATFDLSVKIVVGDVLDAASLKAALIGQEAVISSLGSAASGPFKKVTMLSEGTRNLIAAMKATGVERLICITGFGASESKSHMPRVAKWLILPLKLRGVYRDKTRQEEVVRASGLDWTLVRPTRLTNGVGEGIESVRAFAALTGIDVGPGTIRRADVAAFCLRELADRRFRHTAPVITN